jgi:hypothetical protein
MGNPTVNTPEVEFFPNGIIDMIGVASIPTPGTDVYISADDTVTEIPADASEAIVRKRLGWTTRPYVHGTGGDNRVSVQSRFKRRISRTLGGTVAAGDMVKHEYGGGALNGQVIVWTPGTDDADQITGMCVVGGADTETGYVLEE